MSAARRALQLGFLDAKKTVFFACDIQESFRKAISTFGEAVNVGNKMAKAARIMGVNVYVSEQYPKGLGPTTKDLDVSGATLVYGKTSFSMLTPELLDSWTKAVPQGVESVILYGLEERVDYFSGKTKIFKEVKQRFGWQTTSANFHRVKLNSEAVPGDGICEIMTHVCVEQTAMALLEKNIAVHILADGCISRSQLERRLALERLSKYGCFITTSENVLFKLLEGKTHPHFKEVTQLVRDPIVDSLTPYMAVKSNI